ncbi:hypothetical protein FGSG_12907, partial [Fusarium graminearum PH-1]
MNRIIDIAHRPETPKPERPVIPNEPDVGDGDG